jgi:dolichyl-phosphate-mannose--protein O-mannosyl transferase
VRSQWFKSKVRERAWRFVFYGTCAVWLALVLFYGVTGHDYLLREHWAVSMILPVGGMLGIVVGIRAFFRGYGFLMSVLWGSLGVAVSFALLYTLRFVDSHLPDYFNVVVALLTLLFMVVVHFTDFRRDNQTDASFVRGVLNGEDIKASLLDPLYYTFKTKSLRYKSSKFGVLDDLNDQMRSVAGETSIHYALCSILMAILIAMFFAFSPRFIDMKLPSKQDMKQEQIMELIEKTTE